MLIARSHFVFHFHIVEFHVCKQQHTGMLLTNPKIRCGELEYFNSFNDLVDPASFLFAYTQPTHQMSESLIPRLVFIDETLGRDGRSSWIGYFNTVIIDLDHYGCARLVGILVNQGVRNELTNGDFGIHLHGLP